MVLLSDVPMLSVRWVKILLTAACIFLVYKIVKYFTGKVRELPPNTTNRRQLHHNEQVLDILSMEKSGSGNICLGISITPKQSLVHEHVRDARVLLAKRQPMLRAVIATISDGNKYFEIKEINEVIAMFDITISHVKASDWKDVWFEYTEKQRANGRLLWRVVILHEEFMPDTKDCVNTLMFSFSHVCTDGVSSMKFCKQFLNNMNELANGTGCVHHEISSLDLLPPFHEIVTRGRIWHSLFNFMLAYCGLRSILKFCMERLLGRFMEKKPNNPYHEQFPPNSRARNSLTPSRLNVKVFTGGETKNIIQACKANNCTVTGAITAAAHLAFCELIQDNQSKYMELESFLAINGQRFCDPKPHDDYLGFFVYVIQDFYMKYVAGAGVEFWKLTQEATEKIKEFLRKEAYVVETTANSNMTRINYMNVL
ncbi:Hypothetical predicted protein [Paramuricea clavata]|uniref:Uncharacterized protein n=1 Tax=Paramuricea clavata TaxID=317549 RepID=A0A7D9DTC8_PARCT|nr:Hypothetical predicted protein [Paramuricea clavata]